MERSPYRLLAAVVAAVSIWLATGHLAIPALIRFLYSGSAFSSLGPRLAGHSPVTLDFLLDQWHGIRIFGFVAICLFAALVLVLRSPKQSRCLVGRTTPEAIGAIRMLVCAVLLTSTLWEDLASTAAIPRELIRPIGILQLLYVLPIGFDRLAASPGALSAFKTLTAAMLFAGMIGWRTRWTLPASAVCYLIFGGLLRQYAWFYHTGLIPLYVLIVLCFLPSGDAWSLDGVRRRGRGEVVPPADQPSVRYGWARFAIWTVIAVPYVAAGLSKLRNGGLTWWDAENMQHILFQSSLRPMEFDFRISLLLSSAPDVLFEVLALTALAGELLYGLVLFFGWARKIIPAATLLMHVGILFLQNILFFDLILLQLIFYDWRPVRNWILPRLPVTCVWSTPLSSWNAFQRPERPVTEEANALPDGGVTGLRRLVLSIVGVLMLCWVFRIELYPFTGMQMFSTKSTSPVRYEIALAHLDSGETMSAPIEEAIGAMADSRYRRILQMAFDPERSDRADAFLRVVMDRWNRTAGASRIVAIEIQRREWDFRTRPDDPNHGRIVERRVVPYGSIRAATGP